MITREKWEKVRTIINDPMQDLGTCTDRVLDELGIEVESPELLPGVSDGRWTPCCGHNADIHEYYVMADNYVLAIVPNPANRKLMAQSKRMAEWMAGIITKLEKGGWFPEDRDKGKEILKDAGATL